MKQTFYRNVQAEGGGGVYKKPEEGAPEENSAGVSSLDQKIIEAKFAGEHLNRVRDHRRNLDSLYLSCKTLQSSRAISLAITAFQTARQFAGIILMEKGAANPYPKSTDPSSPQIEPRADQGTVYDELALYADEVAKVKLLRSKAADLITELAIYLETNNPTSPIEFIAQTEMVKGALSGKLWLGERLGEIMESANNK